ncbi:MAG: nitroreductase family protein [Eggerthella lenta]
MPHGPGPAVPDHRGSAESRCGGAAAEDECRSAGHPEADPFYGAPTVLVVLAARDNTNRVYDGSCVMSNLMNAAKAVGLASCWVHRAKEVFDSEEGKALLRQWGVEGDYEGIGHCILGYRADTALHPPPQGALHLPGPVGRKTGAAAGPRNRCL